MLAKLNRIHGRNVFKRILRSGKTVRSDQISLNYSPTRGKNLKAAVVISRKVAKSAVKRNRIRRRIYEVVRKNYLPLDLKHNLIFMVYSEDINLLGHDELVDRLDSLLKKAGLM